MIVDSLKSLIVDPQHPLLVGGGAEAGIVATASLDSSLSTVLQIIIALSALLKLWMDYKRQSEASKTNKPNEPTL